MSTDLIESPKKIRRKSTQRSPRPIKLTDGDADIIRHVAKHRFLRSPDIARLTGRPLEKVRERANELYHSYHLDRPRVQFDLPVEKAPLPTSSPSATREPIFSPHSTASPARRSIGRTRTIPSARSFSFTHSWSPT